MKQRVFFLTRLREGVDPQDYERFLREVDYPRTLELLPVSYYRATRIAGRAISDGDSPYEYIEVLDVEDFDAYASAFSKPEVAELAEQVFSYVDQRQALDLRGEVVE